MTAMAVWVEFYGGPWDGEMREVEADENGVPGVISIGWTGGNFGSYLPTGTVLEDLVTRMDWSFDQRRGEP